MRAIFASIVLSILVLSPALAQNNNNNNNNNNNGNNGNGAHGAPAPLLGAGLPGLGIAVGYGAYWLARRRRNNKNAG